MPSRRNALCCQVPSRAITLRNSDLAHRSIPARPTGGVQPLTCTVCCSHTRYPAILPPVSVAVSSTPHRKSSEPAPYAALTSLRPSSDAIEPIAAPVAPVIAPEPVDRYAAEREQLAQLRAALWAAFEAGPGAVPSSLVDLTMAYTSALRLELNLMAWPRAPAARVAAGRKC